MTPIVAWFMTLIGSVFVASVFIVQYLESKYKPYVRTLEKEKQVLARINEGLIDESLVLRQRYRTLYAETKGTDDD